MCFKTDVIVNKRNLSGTASSFVGFVSLVISGYCRVEFWCTQMMPPRTVLYFLELDLRRNQEQLNTGKTSLREHKKAHIEKRYTNWGGHR